MVRRKSARSQSRFPSILKKFFQIIIGFIVLIFILAIVLFVFFIFAKPKYQYKNIVFIPSEKSGGEGKIILAEFYKNTNSINIITFNGEIKSTLIGGYGEYQLKAVKGVLDIDKKGRGFIVAAFGHFLKSGVDEVIEYKPGLKPPENKLDLVKLFLQNKETFLDISLINDTDSEKINYIKIENKNDWEDYLSKQLTWRINQECTVAIVNSTSLPGLAADFGQTIENSGIEVVRSTTNIWGESKTAFYVDDVETCTKVKDRIKTLIPINVTENLDKGKTAQYRANMVLFIGDELAEFFKE